MKRNLSNRSPIIAATIVGLIVCFAAQPTIVVGQEASSWVKAYRLRYSRDSISMSRLVAPLVKPVKESIVRVRVGGRVVALGTIVGEDGYVLTKRSQLGGDPIRVQVKDGRFFNARVASVRRQNDLALLKIDSDENFTPVKFSADPPEIASFLVSPLSGASTSVGVGTVSVNNRSVGHTGRLGVQLRRTSDLGASVAWIYPGSGADHAGVMKGDLIVAINGQQQADRDVVMETLGGMFPGEVVTLTIVREGDKLDLDAKIREMSIVQETENDSKVNGPRNARLTGFDRVIQHDTVLAPEDCGGPIVDSNGKVVGINIARAGRVVSYALPASLIMPEMVAMLQEARLADTK